MPKRSIAGGELLGLKGERHQGEIAAEADAADGDPGGSTQPVAASRALAAMQSSTSSSPCRRSSSCWKVLPYPKLPRSLTAKTA